MSPLPDDSGILTSSYVYDGGNEARGRWQSVLWRDQTSTSLFSNRESVFSLGQMDPSGRYVVAYSMNSEGDQIQARLVDLSDCDASECSSTPIAGPAVWSPDGRHTLVTEIGSLGQSPLVVNGRTWWFPGAPANLAWRIYLGDEQALDRAQPAILTELGVGRGPFWLDETTFGYLRDVPESSFFPAQELVVASVTNGIPEVILNSASLAEALSGDDGQDDWLIQVVAASPLDPELLFLYVTTTRRGTGSQLVTFDRRTGRIETRLNLFNYDFGSLGFSPDGRWLILVGSGNSQLSAANDQTTLFLHDISRNQTKMLPVAAPGFPTSVVYDWSIDGRWLLIVIDDQLLGLVAPEQDYQRYLLNEAGGACAAVAWIGP
jgi:dipeptidyl aminopeptidase/acylaminoacyl peptidase